MSDNRALNRISGANRALKKKKKKKSKEEREECLWPQWYCFLLKDYA
jgi:hypothetical protein